MKKTKKETVAKKDDKNTLTVKLDVDAKQAFGEIAKLKAAFKELNDEVVKLKKSGVPIKGILKYL